MTTKEQFENILHSITRPNCDINGLCDYLEKSGFYKAPATTKYHHSYEGGLAEFSTNVYLYMQHLAKLTGVEINADSLIITGLLHAVSKSDYYESYIQNKKQYSTNGSKYDEIGKYDWVSEKAYKVRDSENRFTLGGKAFNSYYIISNYLPLTREEISALINQNIGLDKSEATEDLYAILDSNSLLVLLHNAIMMASYLK